MADIILWDEASMIPRMALRVADALLRDLTGVDLPFGGKLFVLGGDFRQVLPVVPRASPEQVVAETIQFTSVWREGHFQKFSLTQNMRSRQAGALTSTYQDWLLQVGAELSC